MDEVRKLRMLGIQTLRPQATKSERSALRAHYPDNTSQTAFSSSSTPQTRGTKYKVQPQRPLMHAT